MTKWVLAIGRGAASAAGASTSLHVADPTDALLAALQGREPRPSRIAAVECCRADAEPAPRPDVDAYRVDEVVHWDDDPDADPRFAVALFYFVRRRPGLSFEAFEARYRSGHAPLARVHHPGVRRYVQSFVRSASTGAPEIDAIAELHFRTEREVLERFYRDAGSPRVIAEDVAAFIDLRAGFAVVTRPAPTEEVH